MEELTKYMINSLLSEIVTIPSISTLVQHIGARIAEEWKLSKDLCGDI